MQIRIDQIARRYFGHVVDRNGRRLRDMGEVSGVTFEAAQAEAREKWPDLEVPKWYGTGR